MFATGLLLVLLYGAVIGLLIAVGISYALVLVIAGFGIKATYMLLALLIVALLWTATERGGTGRTGRRIRSEAGSVCDMP